MSNDYHIIEIIAMTLTVIDYYLQLVQIRIGITTNTIDFY